MPNLITEPQINSSLASIEGVWWLSHAPHKKAFGVFSFTPEKGGTLNLRDHLTSDLIDSGEETIYGDCQGKLFTLFYAVQGKAQISFDGGSILMTQEWLSNLVFENIHVANPHLLNFQNLEFATHLLDQWVNYPKFNRERHDNGTSIHINNPKKLQFNWHDKSVGNIEFMVSDKSSNNDLSISYFPYIRVECPLGLNISDFHRKYLRPFLNFVSLATTGTDFVYYTRGFVDDPNNDGKKIQINIYSGYLMSSKPIQIFKTYKHWIKFETENDFALRALEKWFEIFNSHQDILIEYFAIRYADKSYLEDDYFRIFKVVESWTSNFSAKEKEVDFGEYFELLERVKVQMPQEDYKIIQEKFISITNAGECINTLIERQQEIVQNLIAKWTNFRRLSVNTRTKYAHIGSRKNDKVFDTEGQIVAKHALDLMFISELLRMLELPEPVYLKCLETNESWQYLKQYISRLQPN